MAFGAKLGQCSSGSTNSRLTMALPLLKQSTHGPSSAWICSNSSTRIDSLEDAMNCSSPAGDVNITPAASTSMASTQRKLNRVRTSSTTKSSTKLSANSTRVAIKSDSLALSLPVLGPSRLGDEAVATSASGVYDSSL